MHRDAWGILANNVALTMVALAYFPVLTTAPSVSPGPQEENEAEEELLDAIATALTVVLKRFGDAAMPYVDGLMPSVGSLLVRYTYATSLMHGTAHSAAPQLSFQRIFVPRNIWSAR